MTKRRSRFKRNGTSSFNAPTIVHMKLSWKHDCGEQTLTIGEDGYAVDVVGVTVVDLDAFARHQPPSDTGVVAAGEKLCVADDGQPSYAILVT